MALIEIIKKRYSCRAYLDKEIEKDKLDLVLESARLAPSAKNLQDWRFVVVTDPQKRKALAAAANNQMFIAEAAAVIAACSNTNETMRCGQRIGPIDVAIALEHIALQAAEIGLATCWIGSFFQEQVRGILSIPADIEIIELMSLGYPADKPKKPTREKIEKIVSYEQWNF